MKNLWRLRLLYFFFYASVGSFFPFINVYYRELGLTGTQIGLINTLAPLAGILSMTLWGMLNDRFGRTQWLLVASALGAMSAALGLSAMRSLGGLALMACVQTLFTSSIPPLLDSTTLGVLGQQREHYGRQRVWGSFGFILTSSTLGFVFARTGLRTLFPLYIFIIGLFALSLARWPHQPVRLSRSQQRGLGQMLRQPMWLIFSASLFLFGLGHAGLLTFLGVTVRAMGGSDALVGWSWTMAALSEIPVMFWGAALLRRWGVARSLALGLFLYSPRIGLLGLIPSPEFAPAIALLHGVSYGLFWISAVAFANELAPAELKTTAQGLLVSTISLANVIGATLSGWLFDWVGPTRLFQVLGVLCLSAALLFVGGRLALKQRE